MVDAAGRVAVLGHDCTTAHRGARGGVGDGDEGVVQARPFDGKGQNSGIAFDQVATWVGVGGTATSLSALVQRLDVYDRAKVHGSVVSDADLDDLAARLLAMPVAEVTQLPTMVPGRADVICAGAMICAAVGDRLGLPLIVSEADILDGLVLGLAERTVP